MSMGSYIEYLMQANERRDEEAKREADLGKAATFFVKAMPDALHGMGVTESEFGNMSARDQASAVQGYMQAQALQQAMQKFTEQQGAANALQTAVQQAGTKQESFPGTTTQAAGGDVSPEMRQAFPPMQANVNVPLTTDRLTAAVAANPAAANNPNLDNLLRAIEAQQQRQQAAFFKPGDTNFALPGVQDFRRIPTGPNTSQLIYMPTNPGQAVPITGTGGESLGFGLPGRTGITPLRTEQVTPKQQFDELSKLHREYVRNAGLFPGSKIGAMWQQKADDIASELNTLAGGGAQPGPGTAASPRPTFTKGQRVKQNGMIYEFDGRNWNAVK